MRVLHSDKVWNEMPGLWIRHDTEGGVPYACAGHQVVLADRMHIIIKTDGQTDRHTMT